jgi:hypothetical protein
MAIKIAFLEENKMKKLSKEEFKAYMTKDKIAK